MMRKNSEFKLEEDYAYCEKIIKHHSKSFYYAFSKLPKPKAQAIYAVYAFCRLADDTVDMIEEKELKISQLNQLEEELRLFEKGEMIDRPMWHALNDVFERYQMDIIPFFDQIQGQRMDIDFIAPETLDDLENYSSYVAGSVGLMLLPIIASEAKVDLRTEANSLGVAMQITNILRDVGEDLKNINRVYLPQQLLEEENYSLESLRKNEINDQFICVWERLATHAEELYDQFNDSIHYFDVESRLSVLVSANVYRGILDAVRKKKYDCFSKRQFVTPVEMQNLTSQSKKFLKEKNLQMKED